MSASWTTGSSRRRCVLAAVIASLPRASCGRRTVARRPRTTCSIIGYDREPDTLNRFSTHILEDIQTAVVEGLTITDEHMNIVPLLARGGADARQRRRRAARRRRHGCDLEAAAGHQVARRQAVHLRRRAVHRQRHQRSRPTTPRARTASTASASVDTPDPLTADRALPGGLRAVRAAVHSRRACRSTCSRGATSIAPTITTARSLGTGPYRVAEWRSGEYILLERVAELLARRSRRSRSSCSSSCRTRTRASTS